MKEKITVLIGLILLSVASCYAADRIKGNGKIETRTFQVGDYTQLILGEGIEFEGTSGVNFKRNKKRSPVFHYSQKHGAATLKITTDENLFQWLNVKEKDGKLYVESEDDLKVKPSEMTITGSSSDLTTVRIHGCMDFHNKGELTVDRIRLEVSGVGDIVISDLSAQEITCDVSGVGNIHLDGKAEKGNYYVSGVGKIFAYDCNVKNLKAEVSGVGSMQVMASEHLDAETSGVGNIKYKGTAKAKTSSSGIGRVKNKN